MSYLRKNRGISLGTVPIPRLLVIGAKVRGTLLGIVRPQIADGKVEPNLSSRIIDSLDVPLDGQSGDLKKSVSCFEDIAKCQLVFCLFCRSCFVYAHCTLLNYFCDCE